MIKLVYILSLLCAPYLGFSQFITGTVSDQSGNPLPFVNIYINGTSTGTTSNNEGSFKLKVDGGLKEIVFQYIGYQKHREVIQGSVQDPIHVTLLPQIIKIPEVTISGEEDPANAIIRKAIDKRKFHLKQVQSYTCEAYVKGLMRITDIPEKIFGIKTGIDADGEKDQIVYLSESESILSFQKPDKIKETIVSSKVSGDDQGFSWNSASDFYFDFYRNNVSLEQISERVFISPIAYNAFLFYRYEFIGTFEDEGVLVNKIRVIPKRINDPVFSGIINIVENLWNIHSLDLSVTRQNQINFLDTLSVEQYFLPVKNNIYMPISQRFDFSYRFLKVAGDGYYVGVFKNYDVNLVFEKRYFTNEIIVVEEHANERDSVYWDRVRPIPLTQIETIDYREKDSLTTIKESDTYKDSVDREFNKFSPGNLLTGYTYSNSGKDLTVTTNSLLNLLQYNTVEGLNIQLKADIRRRFENKKRYRISPAVRYGFSNKHFNAYIDGGIMTSQKTMETFWVKGGKYVYQYNGDEPISELTNTIYSLAGEQNYLKLYEKYFASLRYRRELISGLVLSSELEWSKRLPLVNTTFYSFRNKEESSYTSNDPTFLEQPEKSMNRHNALNLTVDLTIRLGEKYITRPDEKFRLGTRYPVFNIIFKKSFDVGRLAGLNFDYLEFSLRDELPLALLGTTYYNFTSGGFINNLSVSFPDYKHFSGNQTIFGIQYKTGFQMLEYYTYSTSKWFAETHAEHHFNGFLFNKLPGIRKLKFQAVAGVHYLYTPDLKSYFEFNIGIENILKVIRVDVITSLKKKQAPKIGIRLGIDLSAFN